jgi:hypothetical protein
MNIQNLNTEPDLQLDKLKIWISGKQLEENDVAEKWFNIIALCESLSSKVLIQGSILCLSDIKSWIKESTSIYENLKGDANLSCIEDNLNIMLKMQSLGNISMEVSITPDPVQEYHNYIFSIDQSYLAYSDENCRVIRRKPASKSKSDSPALTDNRWQVSIRHQDFFSSV